MMTVAVVTSFSLLAITGWLCVIRLIRGGSLADRIVALDTLLLVTVSGIGVGAGLTRSGTFLDVLVVTALLGFVSTAIVARFIERRGA